MNKLFKNKYRIKSIRLKDWDYSSNGYYYITICTKNRKCVLGNVVNGKMGLSQIGEIVQHCWHDLPNHYPNCNLDVLIIMPNHVHGIVIIDNENVKSNVEAGFKPASTNMKQHGLFEIIRAFKTFSSRKINGMQNLFHFNWQRDYYEHIIRDEHELNRIREYITNNPLQWELDRNNLNA